MHFKKRSLFQYFIIYVSVVCIFFSVWLKHKYNNIKLFYIDFQSLSFGINMFRLVFMLLMISLIISIIIILINASSIKVSIQIKLFKRILRYNLLNIGPGILFIVSILIFFVFTPMKQHIFGLTQFHKENIYENNRLIGHAFGATSDGTTYTNSYDAFLYNYEKGYRLFEVDFAMASDGKVVLRHDWDFKIQENVDAEHIPNSTTFTSIPINGKYTPMTFEELLHLMNQYPDIYIITDSKSIDEMNITLMFNAIIKSAKDLGATKLLDRMIVQIYNERMHEVVNNIWPFKHYIYTLYQTDFNKTVEKFTEIARFCVNNDIEGIVMWYYWWNEDYKNIMDKYDTKVFVHTVNTKDLARYYINQGVSGVYTDYLSPEEIK